MCLVEFGAKNRLWVTWGSGGGGGSCRAHPLRTVSVCKAGLLGCARSSSTARPGMEISPNHTRTCYKAQMCCRVFIWCLNQHVCAWFIGSEVT